MNHQTMWQRLRSRFLWVTPNDLTNIMASIQQLVDEVSRQSTVDDSILQLVTSIQQQLKDALAGFNIPPAIQAQIDSAFETLKKNNDRLSQAVTDNTPVSGGDSGTPENPPADSGTTPEGSGTPAEGDSGASGAQGSGSADAEGAGSDAPATP